MQWINVKDNLPPKSTHERTHGVLLWCIDESPPFVIGHGCMSGKNGVNYPFVVEQWRSARGDLIYPTYWMFLPSPPVGKEHLDAPIS